MGSRSPSYAYASIASHANAQRGLRAPAPIASHAHASLRRRAHSLAEVHSLHYRPPLPVGEGLRVLVFPPPL